jgi:thymidine kinase
LRYSLIEKVATKMMICLMRRASIAKQKVQVFKPKIDDRYSLDEIFSHSGMSHVSKPVMTSAEIMSLIEPDNQVVGIDEGQFFDIGLVDVANELANSGRRVIIARLDKDYMGKPFEPMPQLLAIAEFITKTHAICVKCGAMASYSQRTSASTERIQVGVADKYEARCRRCFVPRPDVPTLR